MVIRVLQYSDLENAYDRASRIGAVTGVLQSLRDENTLIIGTGDNIAPGVLSLLTEGRQALEFFEAVQPDLETLGNHDFDYGLDKLHEIVESSPQTWIATNLYQSRQSAGTKREQFGTSTGIVKTAIREVDGSRLGFFGLLDPQTPGDTPTADGMVVTDPVKEAREAIRTLRAQGADEILALAHTSDIERLAIETDVDVILAGHIHEPRTDRLAGTLLTRPGANGRFVVELQFECDRWTASRHDVRDGPTEETIAATFREHAGKSGLDTTVATVSSLIPRGDTATYAGPSRIGSTIAEAYRWWTGADIGLQNSGGIRAGPPLDGQVTPADLIGLVPFAEPVAVFQLEGEELGDVLAERHGHNVTGASADRYIGHISGVHSDGEIYYIEDVPIDPKATYSLATSEYLAHAESEFPTLTGLNPITVSDLTQYEVLIEFVTEHGFPPKETLDFAHLVPKND